MGATGAYRPYFGAFRPGADASRTGRTQRATPSRWTSGAHSDLVYPSTVLYSSLVVDWFEDPPPACSSSGWAPPRARPRREGQTVGRDRAGIQPRLLPAACSNRARGSPPRGSECMVNAIFHILPLQRRCNFRCTPQRGYRAGVAPCIPYLATGGNSSSHFKKITGTSCHASARLRWSQAVSAAPCAKAWRPSTRNPCQRSQLPPSSANAAEACNAWAPLQLRALTAGAL